MRSSFAEVLNQEMPGAESGLGNCFGLGHAVLAVEPAHDSPAAIRASLSEARLRDFHDKRRILVIDDVAHTALNTSEALAKLYSVVDHETDPVRAVQRIKEAQESGTPYDAIVLDLYMPKMLGTDLLRELAPNAPAVVINTGSMMAPAVANLESDIGSYVSERAQALFESIDLAHQALGLPTVAIQTHFKLDSLAKLVDKLDTTMLVRQFVSDGTTEFLSTFKPRLREIAFTDETLHLIAEDVRNIVGGVKPVLEAFRRDTNLAQSSWWQANHAGIEAACEALEGVRFTTLSSETPELSIYKLHDVVNNLARIRPPTPDAFEPTVLSTAAPLIKLWDSYWHSGTKAIDSRYLGLRQYHNGELDVGTFIAELYPDAKICPFDPAEIKKVSPFDPPPKAISTLVNDPDRIVRSFLVSLFDAFKFRISQVEKPEADVDISFYPESYQGSRWVSESLVRRLADINCGDYCAVSLVDYTSRPVDQDFATLAPALAALRKSKLGSFDFQVDEEENYSGLCVYLKISEKAQDFVAEFDRIAERKVKKPDGTWIYTSGRQEAEFKVYEDLGPAGDVMAIGKLPDLNDRYSKPILYRDGTHRIWCNEAIHHSHYWSSALLNDILVELLERSGDSAGAKAISFSTDRTQMIYQEAVRVAVGKDHLYLDLDAWELKSNWAYQTLLDLGVPASKIEANSLAFFSKA